MIDRDDDGNDPSPPGDLAEAARLLDMLVAAGAIEVDEDRSELEESVGEILATAESPGDRSRALDALFLAHEAVADVFWDRDQLQALLAKW